MAKKSDPPPLFDVKGDFIDSLGRFVHEAGMLCDAVASVLRHDDLAGLKAPVADLLRERVAAFRRAQSGES